MTAQEYLAACGRELVRARDLHPTPLADADDALGVLLEEVDEFWDEVRRPKHDLGAMIRELIQVGAMLLRGAEDVAKWSAYDVLQQALLGLAGRPDAPSWHALYAMLFQGLKGGQINPAMLLGACAKAVGKLTEKGGAS